MMKKLVGLLIVVTLLLTILAGCGNNRTAGKSDVEFLTEQGEWYYFDPLTLENEKMSFKDDFSFYWGCECGEPVGNSDLYELYDYDKDSNELRLYNEYDKSEMMVKVVDYSDYHLMLELDGKIKDFTPYSNYFDFKDDDNLLIEGYNSYAFTKEVTGDCLVVGPSDYDGDIEYKSEDFDTYSMSDDIEFYNYFYKSENDNIDVVYEKMSIADGLEAFESSYAFIWFNKDMEISKVMYHGSLIIH